MEVEVTYEDEILEGEGPYERGLWAEARWWVNSLLTVFGDLRAIAAVGLTRRLGLRCRNWLWSVEGMVRRLIIGAALTLDASALPAIAKRLQPKVVGAPAPEISAHKPSCAFRVFRLHRDPAGARRHAAPSRASHEPLPLHRHLVFRTDDLLSLDLRSRRRKPKRSAHRRNPLDRRGRISRFDPLYNPDPAQEEARSHRYMFGPFPERPNLALTPPAPRCEHRRRDVHDPYRFAGASEWRRVEEEWARVIPAPALAVRIAALARAMEKPQRWIERIAREFGRRASLRRILSCLPAPEIKKPKRDSTAPPPGLDFLSRCHAAITDTS